MLVENVLRSLTLIKLFWKHTTSIPIVKLCFITRKWKLSVSKFHGKWVETDSLSQHSPMCWYLGAWSNGIFSLSPTFPPPHSLPKWRHRSFAEMSKSDTATAGSPIDTCLYIIPDTVAKNFFFPLFSLKIKNKISHMKSYLCNFEAT